MCFHGRLPICCDCKKECTRSLCFASSMDVLQSLSSTIYFPPISHELPFYLSLTLMQPSTCTRTSTRFFFRLSYLHVCMACNLIDFGILEGLWMSLSEACMILHATILCFFSKILNMPSFQRMCTPNGEHEERSGPLKPVIRLSGNWTRTSGSCSWVSLTVMEVLMPTISFCFFFRGVS